MTYTTHPPNLILRKRHGGSCLNYAQLHNLCKRERRKPASLHPTTRLSLVEVSDREGSSYKKILLVCSNVPMFSGTLRQNPWRMSCRSTMLKQHSSIKICMDRNQNHSKVARKKGQVKILKQFDQFVGRACPTRLKFEPRDSSLRRSVSCVHFSRFKKTQKVYLDMLKKRRDICECASIVTVQR